MRVWFRAHSTERIDQETNRLEIQIVKDDRTYELLIWDHADHAEIVLTYPDGSKATLEELS